jgi:regulator of protease activity HflC (stomatin/prohibitin superfamily)
MLKANCRREANSPLVMVGLVSLGIAGLYELSLFFRLADDLALTSPVIGAAWILVAISAFASQASPGRTSDAPGDIATNKTGDQKNPGTILPFRLQPWLVLAGSVAALLMTFAGWDHSVVLSSPSPLTSPALHRAVLGSGMALGGAFVTLVLERWFHVRHGDRARGAAFESTARILRVPLFSLVVAAASDSTRSQGYAIADWWMRAPACLVALVATEFAIRAMWTWLTPINSVSAVTQPLGFTVALLGGDTTPIRRLREALREQQGVDLRQSWALRSALRMLPYAFLAFTAVGWMLTGVVVLAPAQRAVYERFGAPAAVWQPGLHVALPWPLGSARLLDNGEIHQVAVSGGRTGEHYAGSDIAADASAPENLNRLWDTAHEGEILQVIGGAGHSETDGSADFQSGARQNFQIVSADIRIAYRDALTDAGARDALYRTVDMEQTVRAVAAREVVHYLASHTLESLLQERQTRMADVLRESTQKRLDELHSGAELTAVVIEAVHPPTGAAKAFHQVQAAQIRAQASIAAASGAAAGESGQAREQASSTLSIASATAFATESAAAIARIDFSADEAASRAGGGAFTFEYFLHHLMWGLRDADLTIVDERLGDKRQSAIDLRSYAPSGDTANRIGQ